MARAIGSPDDISLIKLDIQGSEYEAIEGSSEIIRKSRPVIICEVKSFTDEVDTRISKFMHHQEYADFVKFGKDIIYVPKEKCNRSIINKIEELISNSKIKFS